VRGKRTAPIHSLSSRAIHHLLEALGGMGVDGDALCREVGIAPEQLRDPDGRIETQPLLRLFSVAASRTADPLIGLHVAERIRYGSLASYLVGSQNTVADALTMQSRFQTLVLGATAVSMDPREEGTYVTLDTGSPAQERRHLTEYCLASSCRLMRWLTLQAARPDEVHFRHRPAGDAAEYERVFACPVHFNMRENGAILSRATLAERLISTNETLAAQLERLAQAQMGARAAAPFRNAVVCALRAARMDRASGRREVVARRLGVSARTLQRRLEDEGTSFGQVLDETRRQTALELIGDPALSVGDISSGVGYADQFAFNKAFRRWTGRSPSAYRREILQRDDRSRT
jgi:AraC-like DNA-binding protein